MLFEQYAFVLIVLVIALILALLMRRRLRSKRIALEAKRRLYAEAEQRAMARSARAEESRLCAANVRPSQSKPIASGGTYQASSRLQGVKAIPASSSRSSMSGFDDYSYDAVEASSSSRSSGSCDYNSSSESGSSDSSSSNCD